MKAFDMLRSDGKTDFQFETLVLRYRRLARDYATICRAALSDGAIWDGNGKGSAHAFWLKLIELEQKREGVRVGILSDMLNVIETADDTSDLVDAVNDFADDHSLGQHNAQIGLQAEMLRRLAVGGFTMLKREAYSDVMGPASNSPPNEQLILNAQRILRKAVELDER